MDDSWKLTHIGPLQPEQLRMARKTLVDSHDGPAAISIENPRLWSGLMDGKKTAAPVFRCGLNYSMLHGRVVDTSRNDASMAHDPPGANTPTPSGKTLPLLSALSRAPPPVFCQRSHWVPDDLWPHRIERAAYEALLDSARVRRT